MSGSKEEYQMYVLGINGSARKDGNTALLIRGVFEELKKEGIKTELIQFAGKKLAGCDACYRCFDKKNKRCAITSDALNGILEKMIKADAIILGSPTYFADCSAGMKALMERAGFVSRANKDLFRRKVGAAVVAVRRAGAIHTFDTMNHFFSISEMITVGSSYWNIGIGDVSKDKEGKETMRVLGANMAWLLKKLTV